MTVADQAVASLSSRHGVYGPSDVVVHLLRALLETRRVPKLNGEVALDDGEVRAAARREQGLGLLRGDLHEVDWLERVGVERQKVEVAQRHDVAVVSCEN